MHARRRGGAVSHYPRRRREKRTADHLNAGRAAEPRRLGAVMLLSPAAARHLTRLLRAERPLSLPDLRESRRHLSVVKVTSSLKPPTAMQPSPKLRLSKCRSVCLFWIPSAMSLAFRSRSYCPPNQVVRRCSS